jgi:hypothetical protein
MIFEIHGEDAFLIIFNFSQIILCMTFDPRNEMLGTLYRLDYFLDAYGNFQ